MGRWAGIAVVLASGVLMIPAVLLFQAVVDWAGDRIEAAVPGRRGAEARLWFRLLAPVVLSVALAIVLIVMVADLWSRRGPERPVPGEIAGPARQDPRTEGP